jgi:hypothetical protein
MRLDLLPYYSRMVATLHPGMPDIGDELVRGLSNYHTCFETVLVLACSLRLLSILTMAA